MVTNLYVALCRRLSRKPRNIEECCQLTEFIEQRVEKYNVELQQNIKVMNEYYQLMDDLLVLQQNQQMQQRWKIIEYPQELQKVVQKTLLMIENQRNIFKVEQTSEQEQLVKNTEIIQRQVSVFAHQFQRLDDYEDAFKSCEVIMKQLNELKEKAQLYNKRE